MKFNVARLLGTGIGAIMWALIYAPAAGAETGTDWRGFTADQKQKWAEGYFSGYANASGKAYKFIPSSRYETSAGAWYLLSKSPVAIVHEIDDLYTDRLNENVDLGAASLYAVKRLLGEPVTDRIFEGIHDLAPHEAPLP